MKLQSWALYRKEHFGGIIVNPEGNVWIVKEEVIRELEQNEFDDDNIRQFLIDTKMIKGNSEGSPNRSKYVLKDIKFKRTCEHLSSPLAVEFEITRNCNLNCPHCGIKGGAPREEELTTEEIFSILRTLKEMRVFEIFFTGGEPFVRKDMIKILNYASKLGFHVVVKTNGTLLNQMMLNKISPHVRFGLSLDGYGNDHDLSRGQGNFDIVLQTLELLKKNSRKIGVNFTVTHKNKRSLQTANEMCVKMGIRMGLTPIHPFGRALENSELLLQPEDAKYFVSARKYKINYFRSIYTQKYGSPEKRPLNLYDLEEIFNAGFQACRAGRGFAYITANGEIYPCINLAAIHQFRVGNIKEDDFKKIWEHGDKLQQFRKINKWSHFTLCKECDISEVCNFRCPALSYVLHHDYTTCGAYPAIKEIYRLAMKENLTDPINKIVSF